MEFSYYICLVKLKQEEMKVNYVNFSCDAKGALLTLDVRESMFTVMEIDELFVKLVANNKILLGTKTEGSIDFNGYSFSINQKVCRPMGEFESWDEMFSLHLKNDYGI